MTNNWTDLGNSSLFVVMGANPVENHPASMAHINKARGKGAKLIVIDPRKTRTALQADRFIRIRPGTDIAFINGVVRGIIADMEARPSDGPDGVRDQFYKFLDQTGSGTFFTDGDDATGSTSTAVPGNSKYSDARFILNGAGTDYERETIVAATGFPAVGGESANTIISNFPKKAANVFGNVNTVYNRLKAHVAPYDTATVADICGCTEADIAYVIDAYIQNGRCSSVGDTLSSQDPLATGYKCTTMLYAMGLTQHTHGAQNVKSFTVLQTLMGNMGRAGGGINALRGIHNVQGSTDMGNLYHLIPFYSGNPSTMTLADPDAFGKYMNTLWGVPVSGTGTRTTMNNSYDDAYNTAAMGLQQRGFINMTYNFFGSPEWMKDASGNLTTANRAFTNALYDLWPKTNGDDHVTMFRKMATSDIKAAVVWGQNPAVTEPNQSAIRAGLENLDTLVVVDMFENETAAVKRKANSATYLLPACSHVEEAGSVANSGRVLQWRERATLPKGNSKADIELLFRMAKAFDDAGAFSHITAQWTDQGKAWVNAYTTLYGERYGWTPGATAFEDASGTANIWTGAETAPRADGTVHGSEWVCEQIYRELCTPATGTSWLYTGAYNTTRGVNKHPGQVDWQTANRSKSRNNADPNSTLAYPSWGYAWLVNRRVLYNNADIPGDIGDFYMGPDSVARLFVSTNTATLNYSRWYRTINRLADKPDVALGGPTAQHILPGRFPAHTEPYETPRADLAALWGRNTKGTGAWDLLKSDTLAAAGRVGDLDASGFPLVLTTIRCVEHFQGGPITRNNPWNVEAEPYPWIEINSLDAAAAGIATGDWVNVITARSNSTTDQEGRTTGAPFADGFLARVGVGLQSNQRVGRGVVAIPWHWGDRGLSTGSRANDLCIDAGDANTVIPEYKACLCKIEKA
ncbi:MAG: molybdopterin-dependent oxidoreductase [Actinomycetota bacterium]|nr:molybdopterin-dependent oxidoreductase [Actinomycetota bacterium]